MATKTLIKLVICLIMGAAGYAGFRVWQQSGPRTGLQSATPPERQATPATPAPKPDPKQLLNELVRRWEETAETAGGTARQVKLQAICAEAVSGLGATNELVAFLNFLSAKGADAQREWLLGPGLRDLFSGPQAPSAREQMLTVTHEGIHQTLCHRAGEGFGALGFKEYLDSLAGSPHAACQSPLLAGRCMALAGTSLEGAIYAFRELKTSTINHTCLGEALAECFKNTDYSGTKAALNALPEDLKREAITGLCGKQGKNVGPFLAAIDELINTAEWPKIQAPIGVKLHNLTLYSTEIDTLLAWAALLPERKDTEDLYRVASRPFVTRQPEKAKPWILTLPPGWKRENALAGFVQAALMARGDVPGAQWARSQITDPDFAAAADGWILEYEKRSGKPFPR